MGARASLQSESIGRFTTSLRTSSKCAQIASDFVGSDSLFGVEDELVDRNSFPGTIDYVKCSNAEAAFLYGPVSTLYNYNSHT